GTGHGARQSKDGRTATGAAPAVSAFTPGARESATPPRPRALPRRTPSMPAAAPAVLAQPRPPGVARGGFQGLPHRGTRPSRACVASDPPAGPSGPASSLPGAIPLEEAALRRHLDRGLVPDRRPLGLGNRAGTLGGPDRDLLLAHLLEGPRRGDRRTRCRD